MLVEITSTPTLSLADISLFNLYLLPILALHSMREGGIGGGGGGGREGAESDKVSMSRVFFYPRYKGLQYRSINIVNN